MSKYRVVFSKQALQSLKKMDKSISFLIYNWLKKNIDGCTNPRFHGKGLVENRSRRMEI